MPPSLAEGFAFIDRARVSALLEPFVPDRQDRDFVVRCLLDEGPLHHRGANFALLGAIGLLLKARPEPSPQTRPVPMRLPPHLRDQADPTSQEYPIRLATGLLARLAPEGSPAFEGMVAALLDGPPQHALANVAMLCLLDAVARQQ